MTEAIEFEYIRNKREDEYQGLQIAIGGITVRECITCGCLTVGGPTRCLRCVKELDRKGSFWRRLKWFLNGV
jgi:hypothetical protein